MYNGHGIQITALQETVDMARIGGVQMTFIIDKVQHVSFDIFSMLTVEMTERNLMKVCPLLHVVDVDLVPCN